MIVRLVVLIVALALAAPAAADPPVWRIKQGETEITLFGSVHLLAEGEDWRSPEVRAALAAADQLWFEVPLDAAARAAGASAAAAKGMLPAGQTLTALLAPDTGARLDRISGRLGVSRAQLDPFQPWFVELWISVLDLQSQGARQMLGVDEQIAAMAPSGTPRRAFETPEQQVSMLADQPMTDQVRMLAQTLRDIEEEPDAFARLQKAWIDGDLAWIDREALAPMRAESPRLYEVMVVDRNRRWVETIQRLLKSADHVFIVVGVGHLVGPDSVPVMLRRNGVAVEGP